MSRVVAVVPAKDRADSVGATVAALSPLVDEVVVVDDGSSDGTADAAVGARVVRLARNVGKGGAVTAGVAAAPDADVYLLIDADVAASASVADGLLAPVVEGRADMTVGVLPAAGRRGGFGRVRALAAWGIRRACGFEPRAPLSGQRAVRGELLRSLVPLADRFGLEVGLTVDGVRAGARVVEVDVDMEHRHTGRSVAGFRHRGRQGLDVVRALWPRLTSSALRVGAIAMAFVVLAGVALWQGSRWQPSSEPLSTRPSKVVLVAVPTMSWDAVAGDPYLARAAATGAVAAMNVRTLTERPSHAEGYASLGAGARVAADPAVNEGRGLPSEPGALGAALRAAGKRVAVVGDSPVAPLAFGGAPRVQSLGEALAVADVVLVDQGSAVVEEVPPSALTLVFAVRPPGDTWALAPVMAVGAGVQHGYLHSLSTRREGLVTLTDLAPTVLDALGVAVPDGMIGRPLQYRPGPVDVDGLRELDRDARWRERVYFPVTVAFIAVQVFAYLAAFRRPRRVRSVVLAVAAWPLSTFLLRAVPEVAALGWWAIGVGLAIDVAVVWAAVRLGRRPLAPLAWIAGATVAVLLVDVWAGAPLQASSLMGYSLHTASRYSGLGNTAFAVLASATIVAVCLHVHHAPRRREALATAAGVFGLVALTDGAPTLGADVGGIVTVVPVFGLLLVALAGRRLTGRMVVAAGVAAAAVVAVVAVVDYNRPVPSHLGELIVDVRDGGLQPLWDTVDRKVTAGLRPFRSPWTWPVPFMAVYLLAMLVRGRFAPVGSASRIAAVGVLAAGLLGTVVNDSGVVVTALAFVYVGPLLALVAGERT